MLVTTICVMEYVQYKWDENLQLDRDSFQVPAEYRPMLEKAKHFGLYLEFDGCFNQGLEIKSKNGAILGHIEVWSDNEWLKALMNDLKELVDNPKKYGIL